MHQARLLLAADALHNSGFEFRQSVAQVGETNRSSTPVTYVSCMLVAAKHAGLCLGTRTIRLLQQVQQVWFCLGARHPIRLAA